MADEASPNVRITIMPWDKIKLAQADKGWAVTGQQNLGDWQPVAQAPAPTTGASRGIPVEAPGEEPPRPNPEPTLSPAGSHVNGPGDLLPKLLRDYHHEIEKSTAAVSEGWKAVREEPTLKGKAVGAAKMGLGAVGFGFSPVSAGLKWGVGDPVRETTGSEKAGDLAEFAAGIALPGPKGADKVTKAAKPLEKIVSPETIDKAAVPIRAGRATNYLKPSEEAAGKLRAGGGEAARDTEITRHELEPYRRVVNALSDQDKLAFIHYVENRSKPGAALADPTLRDLADKMRAAFKQREAKLSQLPSTSKMGFVEDYFPHMWQDPSKAQAMLRGVSREGRGGFTKERSIPTLADGIAQGLVPKSLDPIEATLQYIENADRFIGLNRAFDESRSLGLIRYALPGKQPEGWTQLGGRLGRHKGNMLPYAPEGYARVYNNFVSKGLPPDYKAIYDTLQRGSNTITAMELGLSGYHAITMANEAMINSLANSIGAAKNMRFGAAAKHAAETPFAPITRWRTGKKLEQAYLGNPASKEFAKMADLLEEAGGRAKSFRQSTDYQFSGAGSYFTAWRQGALKTQMLADAEKVKSGFQTGIGAGSLASAKAIGSHIGRAMDTFAQPLFEKYIPMVKNGAFYDNMARWIAEHPGAAHEEQVAAARKIWDSVDNRFGEMVQNNIFWDRTLKQASMLAMRSYSWNLGTVREIGGGARDILSHKWTQKTEYVLALALQSAMISAAYQYFKTGEPPADMQDLIAPRTGGVDPGTGMPERVVPPGYMKDVHGWYEDPVQEAKNKMATGMRLTGELLTNKDWRGAPIAPPKDPDANWMENVPPWMVAYFTHVAQAFVPFSLGQAAKGRPEGGNLSTPEMLMGMRPAGMKYTDPETLENMLRKKREREWNDKLRYDQRQQRKYGGVE